MGSNTVLMRPVHGGFVKLPRPPPPPWRAPGAPPVLGGAAMGRMPRPPAPPSSAGPGSTGRGHVHLSCVEP
eukprot:1924779-Pyramimonas_sp.AAC.1